MPQISDYKGISNKKGTGIHKRHESDYYLIDQETGMHYLIELKIGGDLDNKKARSEKEALLEQYCILTNDLGSEEQVLSVIYPGQEFVFGSQAFSVEEAPETVEFEVLPPSDYNLTNASTAKAYKPLTIINDKIRSERYVGEVSNPNDYAIDSVRVMITGWDSEGNLIEIEGGFVNDLPANGTVPFDISLRTDQEIAKYEAFANQW